MVHSNFELRVYLAARHGIDDALIYEVYRAVETNIPVIAAAR